MPDKPHRIEFLKGIGNYAAVDHVIYCDTPEDAKGIWDALSDAGTVISGLERATGSDGMYRRLITVHDERG